MRYDEETAAEAREREELEAGYEHLFKEVISGSIQHGLPMPWEKEYRDLLRACVEARSTEPIDRYIEDLMDSLPGATIH